MLFISTKSFIVTSIMNNNAVLAISRENRKEYIIFGKGIGFACRKGDTIFEDMATKMFIQLDDKFRSKMLETIGEIPLDCIEITMAIIEVAESKLNKTLSSSLFWNLADHINFTIKRYKEGFDVPSLINEEIKRFYQTEYEIGKTGVKMINDYYHIQLNHSEAGSIAFHIINATESLGNADTRKIVNGVRDIIAITEDTFQIKLDSESLEYSRYVIHLKYFLKSILNVRKINNKNNFLLSFLSQIPPEVNECLVKINDYTNKIFGYKVSKDERTYLAIHLMRIYETNKENT